MPELRELRPLHPPREPAPENAWSRDLVLTLVAVILCSVSAAAISGRPGALLASLIALPLIFRRHYPMLMLYGSTLGALCQLPLGEIQFSVVVVPFVIYQVARWIEPSNAARLAVILGAFGSVLGPLVWVGDSAVGGPSMMVVYCFTCMVTVLTAYVIGRRRYEAVRASDERKMAAETTLRMQLAASEQRARAAEVNERNRIARELHDIVAHSLSVIVVQAEGGRALAAKRPEMAADVLDTIAETSRESLVEMRRIVGVLRHGPERGGHERGQADWKPAPGLPDLAELVSRTTPRATLTVHGRLPVVSQTLGLTVYRIVQEALTNMLKHGGPRAHAQVVLECRRPGELALTVLDDGRGAQTSSDGQGNGLRGMRERVALVGGRLQAGPRREGGFEVRAGFPLGTPQPGPTGYPPRPPTTGEPPRPTWAPPPARAPIKVGRGHPPSPYRPPLEATRPLEPARRPDDRRLPGLDRPPEPAPPGDDRRPQDGRTRVASAADEPTTSVDAQPTVQLDPELRVTEILPTAPSTPPHPERGRP